jgi:hypothetical protein
MQMTAIDYAEASSVLTKMGKNEKHHTVVLFLERIAERSHWRKIANDGD